MKYAVKIFFSPHFTAFLTKIHRVFYEFPLLNIFLPESAFQLIFLSNQASSDSSLQTISISNNFSLFSNFYSFFSIIQEFQTKPLVLVNFPFEPLRNNAITVFFFSKNRKIQSIKQLSNRTKFKVGNINKYNSFVKQTSKCENQK